MNNLPKDPIMLLSVVNMKLRDFYSSLEEMCEDMDIRLDEIVNILGSVGFEYDREQNRFK